VVLHAYEPPANTPQCVELQDAEAVLPRGDIDHLLRARRFATVADLFRYEMLAQSLGVWVDCDCYCLKPIQDEDHIFGWEDESWINGAVLKLPADSAVLKNLWAGARFPEAVCCATDRINGGRAWTERMGWNRV
jgi:hypothetical protein